MLRPYNRAHKPFRPVAPLAAVLASSIRIDGFGPGRDNRLYAISAPVKPEPMITMSTSWGKIGLRNINMAQGSVQLSHTIYSSQVADLEGFAKKASLDSPKEVPNESLFMTNWRGALFR